MNIKKHRLLKETSGELYKIIKDYDVCEKVALNYLSIKEKMYEDENRNYHHNCLKDLCNNENNNISWVYYIPFTQCNNDAITTELLCAHMNKKDRISVYLKILASKQGIRVLGDVICGAIGIEYFKENLTLRDKINEINDMKYHMLISCYNNLVLD